ncbi:MAG: hypothetical protein AB7I59_08765 [Geminicoccaceae bacterium]
MTGFTPERAAHGRLEHKMGNATLEPGKLMDRRISWKFQQIPHYYR